MSFILTKTNICNHRKYSNEPYIGFYKWLKPAIIPRDPDLIKDILVTNFNSFRNNETQISKKHDPLSATNPFFNQDDEWREGRKAISPMFSQSKVLKQFKHLAEKMLN